MMLLESFLNVADFIRSKDSGATSNVSVFRNSPLTIGTDQASGARIEVSAWTMQSIPEPQLTNTIDSDRQLCSKMTFGSTF